MSQYYTKETKKEFEENVLNLFKKGKKSSEIAKELNVPARITFRILKRNGLTGTQKLKNKNASEKLKVNLDSFPIEEITDLYSKQFKTIFEISKIYKTHPKNIKSLLTGSGVKLFTFTERVDIENKNLYDDIRNLYLSGLSIPKVATRLNISKSNVHRILSKFSLIRTDDKHSLGCSYEEYLEKLPIFKKYNILVRNYTKKEPINSLSHYQERGIAGVVGAYHLDHRYSISEGFKNNIHPKIIGNIKNLEFIPFEDNLKKHKNCSITLEKLINEIGVLNKEEINWI